jgi:hypothetical protein
LDKETHVYTLCENRVNILKNRINILFYGKNKPIR